MNRSVRARVAGLTVIAVALQLASCGDDDRSGGADAASRRDAALPTDAGEMDGAQIDAGAIDAAAMDAAAFDVGAADAGSDSSNGDGASAPDADVPDGAGGDGGLLPTDAGGGSTVGNLCVLPTHCTGPGEVCCVLEAPSVCQLDGDCMGDVGGIPCDHSPECTGGNVCCSTPGAGQFCTTRRACSGFAGEEIP